MSLEYSVETKTLSDGYETLLDARGAMQLSGGQRQKIGLARAIYGHPKLLVLDEPTSNLDEQSEQELVSALGVIKERGCTCVMVTHKPSMLQSMDKILVLRDGKFPLFGPKDQVFAKLAGGAQQEKSVVPQEQTRVVK